MDKTNLKVNVIEKYKNFLEVVYKFILKDDLKYIIKEKIENDDNNYFKIFFDNFFIFL